MKRYLAALMLVTLLAGLSLPAAAETLDQYFTARFSASPAVYSGPSTAYYRANNGKAQYGGGGQARVYGREGSWLLIGYQTGQGNYRIGYIDYNNNIGKMTTSSSGYVRTLHFEYRSAWTAVDCELTDDPVITNAGIYTVPRGTQLTYLASYDDRWAYVELRMTDVDRKARGFIQKGSVSFSYVSPSGGHDYDYDYDPDPFIFVTNTPQPVVQQGIWATASDKLATRSGPSTSYSDTGTYYLKDQSVYVMSKHYDSYNGIWWVKCRIEVGSTYRYLWTGVKRFYYQDWLLSMLPTE